MALFDAFLNIEGIKGESTDREHPDEIALQSWSWGEGNPSNPQRATGGAGAGKVAMQDFHFSMAVSRASPELMVACATGKHFKDATLTARKAGEKPLEFLVIKMTDIVVTSYQTDGKTLSDLATDQLPTDQISLNFAKIEFSYKGQQGTTGAVGR
jgi:type VI secretion system secreted protein Hcp